MTEEEQRLDEDKNRTKHWRRWGPYLSERQWGTVREDYSPNGTAWEYFPHDHARSRAYRWGEDGLLGISDNHQRLCFAPALWNGKDPILKERFFGLNDHEGNHGEDVKEYYFYLDNTPTHAYMKALYKYPQRAYPYSQLLEENRKRGRQEREFELLDTGIFDDNRYFDVFVEYAKGEANTILIRFQAINRGPDPAVLHLLPSLWFRNTWSWGRGDSKPSLNLEAGNPLPVVRADHKTLGSMWLSSDTAGQVLFTENETNVERLFGVKNNSPYVKDGINNFLVKGIASSINPEQTGTKAALHCSHELAPGDTWTMRLCLTDRRQENHFGPEFDKTFIQRKEEADRFYKRINPHTSDPDATNVQRQAFAGLLWSKQFYHYVVKDWLEGDPKQPPPPEERADGRNSKWKDLYSEDILSIPDKWEFPWFASWDLAFQCIVLAMVDPGFAKNQLIMLTREWYMHPNGQIPAYEWAFGDVNPAVHAWAAWRVYRIEQKIHGRADLPFLERVFQKLLLNFTWWVNREDSEGNNIFEGGFLGLDNIGLFDRSKPLPAGYRIGQSDGTSWMAMYCLNMLAIAVELAQHNHVYEDIASKFFEHFLHITNAMRHIPKGGGLSLWDEQDGFFYDALHLPDGRQVPLKIRSVVGLIPLFAVETLEADVFDKLPAFAKRFRWFMENRPELARDVTYQGRPGVNQRLLLSVASPEMLGKICGKLLDENEFLSPHGIRALSRYHRDHPYILNFEGQSHVLNYEPGESQTGLFGGNSNWRGPVWMPVNFLLIEALQRFHFYLGDGFKVQCPSGSGKNLTLWEVSLDLNERLNSLFTQDQDGKRPVFGNQKQFQIDPNWKDLLLFNEYFHGETGEGLGASHQTGWTALVAKLIQQFHEYDQRSQPPAK